MSAGRRTVRAVVGLAVLAAFACEGSTAPEPCVLGVTASPTSVSLEPFESTTITASATSTGPCGAVSRIWTSANHTVAAVDANGVVTGVTAGTTEIRVLQRDETDASVSAEARVAVTVVTPVAVAIAAGSRTLAVGETRQLTASVTGTSNTAVTWGTSAPAVVQVSGDGSLLGVGPGSARVTATSVADPRRSASVDFTLSVGVTVSPAQASIRVGNMVQLTASVTGAVNSGVTWTSSASEVATVDANGLVRGVAAGTVEITATSSAAPSQSRKVTITVLPMVAIAIAHAPRTLSIGQDLTLSATVIGADPTVSWSSSNGSVVVVASDGRLTAVGAGSARVTATLLEDPTQRAYRDFDVVPSNVAVGDALFGGIVAYLLQPGDPGYAANAKHGIIVAPTDQAASVPWGCFGPLGAGSRALGSGFANTATIVARCPVAGTAARVADELTLGGYDDWFLPSQDELQKLWEFSLVHGGGFSKDGIYWSSTETNPDNAWGQTFDEGKYTGWVFRATQGRVRAIRTF